MNTTTPEVESNIPWTTYEGLPSDIEDVFQRMEEEEGERRLRRKQAEKHRKTVALTQYYQEMEEERIRKDDELATLEGLPPVSIQSLRNLKLFGRK